MAVQRHTIHAVVYPGDERGYIAECLDLSVVTQGNTLDEVAKNLREAVRLHLDGEDLAELRLAPNPTLLLTFEMEPEHA
jgi:predicted RNase H-like HicB family nuclease